MNNNQEFAQISLDRYDRSKKLEDEITALNKELIKCQDAKAVKITERHPYHVGAPKTVYITLDDAITEVVDVQLKELEDNHAKEIITLKIDHAKDIEGSVSLLKGTQKRLKAEIIYIAVALLTGVASGYSIHLLFQ